MRNITNQLEDKVKESVKTLEYAPQKGKRMSTTTKILTAASIAATAAIIALKEYREPISNYVSEKIGYKISLGGFNAGF